MATVLCTGSDKALMNTRKLLLESAGHKVITAMTPKGAQDACERHAVEVVVLGQAMHAEQKKSLFDVVRKVRPQAKVLELHDPFQKPEIPGADGWLAVPSDVPSDLAEQVALLAPGERARASKNASRSTR